MKLQLSMSSVRRRILSPYLLLGGTLFAFWVALWMRGFDLGVWGDVLAYEYHYSALGVRGGISWLVNTHWHRHLLAGLWSAPLHVLFPGQGAAWWASLFGLHFLGAFVAFALFDRVLQHRWRVVSFGASLLFALDSLHIWDHFEFGTNGVRNGALVLALLSMIAYFEYVKGDRRRFAWLGLSLLFFLISMMSYEQNQLFFLAYPLLALFAGQPSRRTVWDWKILEDLFLFPVLVALYVFLLWILYPTERGLAFTTSQLLNQVTDGLRLLLDPGLWLERISPTLQADMLLLTLSLVSLFFLLLAGIARLPAALPTEDDSRALLWRAVLFGALLALLTILGVAPTSWPLRQNPRLIYAASLGLSFAGMALLMWAMIRLSRRFVFIALILPAIVAGAGASLGIHEHTTRLSCQAAREAVMTAIKETIPSFTGETPPYLLLISDAHPSDDLCLNAQDINYPYMFALLYNLSAVSGDAIYADALYFDVPETQRPAPEISGAEYSGQYIVVESEGIYSPLRPGVPIDPESLVIVRYDAATQTASIVDQLPDDVVAHANIEERVPIAWTTNYALIGR